jgi:ATP-dependent Zn protease
MFGGITKSVVSSRGPPPSVEISYSSFLDLIEAQGKLDAPVTMDQVRVGADRIMYRLYRSPDSTADRLSLELPTMSSSSAQKLSRQRHPYLAAYTRKVSASQELVEKFRENKISFAAATAPRASSIGLVLRTAMVAFYFLILFRIYRTVSSAGGNSKSDVPGKLAQTSDLPRASFDEIQGIDDAKSEVMELVDALRNPEKYAILGARAPTGLLLVGPPGTGSKYCLAFVPQTYRLIRTSNPIPANFL